MALLTREKILSAHDMKTVIVHVPEWDGDVSVRTLSAAERDNYEAGFVGQKIDGENATLDKGGMINLRARLVSWTVVNEQGENIFTEEDVVELGKKNAAAVDRIFDAARKISGLTKQDVKVLQKLAEKN